jgi:thiamine-phosphate pyrophosphorylase
MPIPRLFLVAPQNAATDLWPCIDAACAEGDVASIVLPPELARTLTRDVQAKGVAVLTTGDPRNAARFGCDGLHIEASRQAFDEARSSAGKDRIVGAYCNASRHLAMDMAEAGADYVAFSQNAYAVGGEPIIAWWSSLFETPCVAFDPVEPSELDILLPQNPDFIRPSDAMWLHPEGARRTVSTLMQRLTS